MQQLDLYIKLNLRYGILVKHFEYCLFGLRERMNTNKKYRLYGFIIPVIVLFYLWNISTYDGISIWYLEGDFADFLDSMFIMDMDISSSYSEIIVVVLYILLNILAWLFRGKTAFLLEKIFKKI